MAFPLTDSAECNKVLSGKAINCRFVYNAIRSRSDDEARAVFGYEESKLSFFLSQVDHVYVSQVKQGLALMFSDDHILAEIENRRRTHLFVVDVA